MAITPEDLITKSFKIVTEESGYDRNEVDDFLDELVVELRALYSDRDALERQVEVDAAPGQIDRTAVVEVRERGAEHPAVVVRRDERIVRVAGGEVPVADVARRDGGTQGRRIERKRVG